MTPGQNKLEISSSCLGHDHGGKAHAITGITRLAPSPTGALHLGNARTFVVNWVLARQLGWKVVLRIEDLDGPRVKAGSDQLSMDDMRWLGLDWDSGPTYQRHDQSDYHRALSELAAQGLIYPCRCSRREIEQAQSAPNAGDNEVRYPGMCRPITPLPVRWTLDDPNIAWRLRVPEGVIKYNDRIAGPQCIDVQANIGDFVVCTKSGLPAYQLAVVVDDAKAGVTEIVRGDDLITSAARQLLIYRALSLAPEPRYWHLPLVLGSDGRRLAKRHGDTRLVWYRQQGVSPQRILGLLAQWCGITPLPEPMSLSEFLQHFRIERLPPGPVTMTQENHTWLMS